MHLFAIFFHEKICLPFVYHRCVLQIILLSLCVNFYAVKFVIVRKELKVQAQYFTVKAYIPFKLLFVSTIFDPIYFFLSLEWLVKDTNLRCLLHLWISFNLKRRLTVFFFQILQGSNSFIDNKMKSNLPNCCTFLPLLLTYYLRKRQLVIFFDWHYT